MSGHSEHDAGTRRRLLAGLAVACLPRLGGAQGLAPPKGPVLLSLSGRITCGNTATGRCDLDLAALAALPGLSLKVRTPWEARPRTYAGPRLRDVLELAGAQGTMLHATALNDYRVDIPVVDALRWDMIVAHRLDGQAIRVRDRGPLMVIYPYDQDPVLNAEVFHNRSIWQLRHIEVR